jgi:hypothetical protein
MYIYCALVGALKIQWVKMHGATEKKEKKTKFIGWCSCEHAPYTDVVLHEFVK